MPTIPPANHKQHTPPPKKKREHISVTLSHQIRRRPTLPPVGSTIGAKGLNFSVRNGKRWIPFAIDTF